MQKLYSTSKLEMHEDPCSLLDSLCQATQMTTTCALNGL